MHQVRDFIAANWSLFTSHIREKSMTDEQAEEEAQRIFVVVGGGGKVKGWLFNPNPSPRDATLGGLPGGG
ncbi:hypothetical protein [Escherichia coli]|uniref:hypothetical protein n=1 Tax=Escherichia coli TaxID=562 RepID=UPI001562443C|nr:hypothetical protein [Escherichia coli]